MVQVQVREGLLEGEMIENEFGGSFYSFKGIPYAEPPLGDLRFKDPQPKQPWDGVRSAKEHGPSCYQANPLANGIEGIKGSEDCLYLNVYTPDLKPSTPLPVMFWIHGGGFIYGRGDSDRYGPNFLVKETVILVTTNYRLEILGFLCLDTEDVPGNAGMKDQVAALRWVKDNIANFGGDPDSVTIFGVSAGGASVTYHMISPMSKGLFKRAIAQSGAATNPWAKSFAPRERARILARKLGFNSDDDNELYQFFKTQPVEKLVAANVAVTLVEESIERDEPQYNIVAEKKFHNIEGFLYEDPYDALRNNGIHDGIDFMAGYTLDEGLMQMAYPADISKVIDQANKFHEVFVPKNIALNCKMSDQFEVGKRLKHFYFGNEEVTQENLGQLIKYYGTDWFVYGIVQFHKFSAKNSNSLYFYKFSCCSERNIFKYILNVQHVIGNKPVVSHADDVPYLFPMSLDGTNIDQESETYKLIDNVVKLWTNFAKYGNPTPDEALGVTWEQYSPQQQKYLDIGNKLVPGIAPDAEEITCWEDIYKQYLPDCVADAPQPKQPWDGIRSAKEHGPICYQANPLPNEGIQGSEDCLYLNVYTPDLKPSTPLPVMFWIHGGGFMFGNGNTDLYGPDFLVKEGVILVTTNYRLEILGFLCLNTEDVPGNAGMKDQVAALRWVKDNIANFGGDPDNVTIFGESAGGASVTYHMISPMSKGLFKRAIAQSGAATNQWSKSFAPHERARILARKLGFNSDDDNDLYEFFKTQPVENLIAANVAVTLAEESLKHNGPQYNIVAEKKFENIEGFLYEDPYDALRNNGIHGGIDFMAGYNLDEGLVRIAFSADIPKVIDQANKFHEVFVPENIALNCKMSDQFEIGRRLKKLYFGNEEVTQENFGQLLKYYGTDWFIYGIVQFHKLSAKTANSLYFYKFSCFSERNVFKYIMNVQQLIGDKPVVSHADDLPYLFPISLDGTKIDQESETYKLIDNVVKLWTNFAKYGNPTPDEALGVTWEQYSPQQQKYLDIGNKLVPGIAPDAEEITLWENIYKQYLPECVADV